MKLKPLIFALLVLCALAITITSAYAAVASVSIWDDTDSLSLSITNGQSAGFTIGAESLGETPVRLTSNLYRENTLIASLLNFTTTQEYRYSHYTLHPSIYQTPGDYIVRTTVEGASTRDVSELYLHVEAQANSVPVITSTPPITVNENSIYTYQVTATDADGDALTYRLLQSPAWLTISTTGLIRGTSPRVDQDLNYAVTVEVSDGRNTARQGYVVVVRNMQTSVNAIAIWDDTTENSRSISNGSEIGFTVGVESLGEESVNLKVNLIRPSETVTLINVNTNQESHYAHYTLSPAQYVSIGTYTVRVTATGQSGTIHSAELYLAVANNPPVFADIPDRSIHEGETVTFTTPASDADGNILIYSAPQLPRGARYDPATQAFSWTPDYHQGGAYRVSYPITFQVTDGTSEDTETVFITVYNLNQPPVLDHIGDKVVNENELLSFTISATDVDAEEGSTLTTLTYSAASLPAGASFNPATRTVTWTPTYEQSGEYLVSFVVSDGEEADHETITITVLNTNRAPILNPLTDKAVREGDSISFVVDYSDPDAGDQLMPLLSIDSGISVEELARIITVQPIDARTSRVVISPDFDFVAHPATVRDFQISFAVRDREEGNPEALTSTVQTITVHVDDLDRAPVLVPIGDKFVDEGGILTFSILATDEDGDALSYSTSVLPQGAAFDPATRIFLWSPDFDQAGTHDVRFTASSFGSADSETITITVNNVNRAPEFDPLPDATVAEGTELAFTVSATDADGDVLTYSIEGLPEGAVFEGTARTFSWTPGFEQAGEYTVTFIVSDAFGATDRKDVRITVTNTNRVPVIDEIPDATIAEGETLTFMVSAIDADGDALAYSTEGLPEGAIFDEDTKTFSWTPDYGQAGRYTITFIVADGQGAAVREEASITVSNTNRAPVLDEIPDATVAESETLTFTVSATDADGDTLAYSVEGLPSGAVFDAATQTFAWTPTYDQAGVYTVTVIANDGNGGIAREDVIITVTGTNRAPILDAIGNKTTDELVELRFTITGSDPDGDALVFSASGLPMGAVFDPATRSLSWTPTRTQAGAYSVSFTISDGVATDEEIILITVNNLPNEAPVLDPISDKVVDEGARLTFAITATDVDGDTLTFSASGLPAGAGFDPATQTFTWVPNSTQQGTYNVTFAVSDGFLADEETITITVNNLPNTAPILDLIANQILNEGETLVLDVTFSDANSDPLEVRTDIDAGITIGEFNSSFTIVRLDENTERLTFAPTQDFVDHPLTNREFSLHITVRDRYAADPESLMDDQLVSFRVNDVNQLPVFDSVLPEQTVEEQGLLTFTLPTASDADGDAVSYATNEALLPAGSRFDAVARVFTWTPDFTQAGVYVITFTATDSFGGRAEQTVTITVGNVNRAPVFDPVPADVTTNENELVTFSVSATDADGDALAYRVEGLPAGAVFDEDTRTFSWTPSYDQAGTYTMTFVVDDGQGARNSVAREDVIITVGNVNRAPILDPLNDVSVEENELLSILVHASDEDGDPLLYSIEGLPRGARFDANTQIFTWTPGYDQAGEYIVTFIVEDNNGGKDQKDIVITIGNVNRPFQIISQPGDLARISEEYRYQVVVYDPDNDPVTYTLVQGPAGMTMSSTGLVRWTPESREEAMVRIAVTDGVETKYQQYRLMIRKPVQEVKLASIHVGPEAVHAGDLVSVSITLANDGSQNLKKLQTSVLLPEFGVKRSLSAVNLAAGERRTKELIFPVPEDAQPGEYLLKVTVGNGKFQEAGYRVIHVEE